MSRRAAVLVPLLAAAMFMGGRVSADEYHVFLTASCLPQIGFFSIQTHGVYNPRDGAMAAQEILTPQKLEQGPYTCRLAEGATITVKGFCRLQVNPAEIPCVPGSGMAAGVQEIGVFVNDELLALSDPPSRTTDKQNWLRLSLRMYFPWHSVEILGAREGRETRLHIIHCRLHERDRLDSGPSLSKAETECQSFRKVISN